MIATNVIHTVTNDEFGIEARVAEITAGFSVTVRDLDADEVVGIAIIYPTADRAIAKANEVAA
jgi:hypothetical protein